MKKKAELPIDLLFTAIIILIILPIIDVFLAIIIIIISLIIGPQYVYSISTELSSTLSKIDLIYLFALTTLTILLALFIALRRKAK